jgi:hypothetical protein
MVRRLYLSLSCSLGGRDGHARAGPFSSNVLSSSLSNLPMAKLVSDFRSPLAARLSIHLSSTETIMRDLVRFFVAVVGSIYESLFVTASGNNYYNLTQAQKAWNFDWFNCLHSRRNFLSLAHIYSYSCLHTNLHSYKTDKWVTKHPFVNNTINKSRVLGVYLT